MILMYFVSQADERFGLWAAVSGGENLSGILTLYFKSSWKIF